MEAPELNDPAFWASGQSRILWNPARGEPPAWIGDHLSSRAGLAGHLVFATSGTEGVPKHVCLSKKAILVSARAVNRHLDAGPADRWVSALPLFHAGGFGVHARAHLAGCEVFAHEAKWDPGGFARLCREREATLSALVPAQVCDLAREGLRAPESLRAVIVGGGGLGQETGDRAWELGWPLLQSYGLSEAASQVATAALPSLRRQRFESAALPVLEHWEVRQGAGGVLEIRGDALLSGYLREERGAPVFEDPKRDGWFATRDIVRLEGGPGERLLSFERREGDAVKILGELVFLNDLRERLDRCAGECGLAGRAALAAVADERRGTRLVLVCAAGAGAAAAGILRKRFDEGLPGCERIAEIVAVAEIPGADTGKIDYARLNRAILAPNQGI